MKTKNEIIDGLKRDLKYLARCKNARNAALIREEIRDLEIGNAVTTCLTNAEKLDCIRNSLGLSMSALANILKASRASVHNWLEEDEPPSQSFIFRIEKLYSISQEWAAKNNYHFSPSKLIRQSIGETPSVYELLCQEKLNNENISMGTGNLLQIMHRAKKQFAKSTIVNDGAHSELLER